MKQVIFVCLLSLSVCLSQAGALNKTDEPTTTPALQQNAITTEKNTTKPDQTQAAGATQTAGAAQANASKPTKPEGTTETQNSTNAATTSDSNKVSTTETNLPSNKTTNSTDTNAATTTLKPVDGKNETNSAVTTKPPATNNTNADGKDGKKIDTTTPKGEIVSPTVAPVEAKSRAFDGPSFIGGIILTLGLLAIGFMGFKYYKNQTERNYHTL